MIPYENCALNLLVEELTRATVLSIDIETSSLSPFDEDARIKCIAFSFRPGEAITLPTEGWSEPKWKEIHAVLKSILENPGIKKVGHNLQFERSWIKKIWGIEISGIFHDTQVAHFEVDKLSNKGLKDLSWSVGMGGYERTLDKPVQNMDGEKLFAYCSADSDASHRLVASQLKVMPTKMTEYYNKISMPLIHVFSDLHLRGVKVDVPKLNKVELLGEELVSILRTKFVDHKYVRRAAKAMPYGNEFNPNSARHVRFLLYAVLGAEVRFKTTKAKEPAVHAEALQRIAEEFPNIVNPLLEYRTTNKFYTTYVKGLRKHIRSDNRIHSTFSQTVARSGRSASRDPNLQNIPHTPKDIVEKLPTKYHDIFNIRNLFIPDDDCVFLESDYSQIELRVAAAVSKDRAMTKAYLEGKDLHDATAAWMFPGFQTFTEEQRRKAKTINFGVLYGMSAYELANRLSIPETEARTYISNFFRKYSGYARLVHEARDFINEHLYIETVTGRRRNCPPLKDLSDTDREAIYRELINVLIQEPAYSLLASALIKSDGAFKQAGLKSYCWNSIHDSNCFNTYKDEKNKVMDMYTEIAENPPSWLGSFLGDIKLKVDWSEGERWGEMGKI